MNHIKSAAAAGLMISALNSVYGIYTAVRISAGFAFQESLLPELKSVLFNLIILSLPGIIILFRKNAYMKWFWTPWLYPAVTGSGLAYAYTAGDALAAGLAMMFTVFPFCIVFSVVVLLRRKKEE
ncbi:MAG: hypothetical protein L0Y76_00805 [Ignavibacteria bacterium]|nr:hypothetical protein [Ignavibacteria bacterium]